MASRYWVGNSTSPDTLYWTSGNTTPWSATSGGAGGASEPTSSDNVFFDANSGNCDLRHGSAQNCNNLDCTGYTGTWSTSGGGIGTNLQIYGNFTLSSGMTWSCSKHLSFLATATGKTVTTNGIQIVNQATFAGVGGGWTLQDTLIVNGVLKLSGGTLNLGNQNVTALQVDISGSSTRTLTMGSGTITITSPGSGSSIWNASTTTNLTLNANTSTIKLTGALTSGSLFSGGGLTYNNFWNATTGSYSVDIDGSNTFNDLKVDAGRTQKFYAGTTSTVTTLTAVGTSGSPITITSATNSTHTLSDSAGTNTVSYCTISYSVASGGATWAANDGTNTDGGNNSGWTFDQFTNPTNAYSSNDTYATVASTDGDITVQLSGDAGANYTSALTKTFTGVEASQTYGNGSTELWGRTWTGDDVDDTSFRVKVGAGTKYQVYTTLGFAPAASVILTGIEVSVEAKWNGATTSIDHIKVKIYYGTSTVPVEAGTIAYATDGGSAGTGALAAYNGSALKQLNDTVTLTGDVTGTGTGSFATTLAAGSASNLNSGTLLAARMPALTGGVTSSAGSIATTVKEISSDVLTTDSNPYKFYAYRSAAMTSSNAATKVAHDAELYDTNSNFDAVTNNRYTAPVNGFYLFIAGCNNDSASATPIFSYLYKNGADVMIGSGDKSATGVYSQVVAILQLVATDYVEHFFIGGSGSSVDEGSNRTFFQGILLCRT